MRDLAGRTAIVTGASAGIGSHIARALANEQVNVVLAARSTEKLETLAKELASADGRAIAVPTDVTRVADLQELVARAAAEFGSIDVLVNNAGIETFSHYHELDIADIQQTIEVNVTSALVLTRLVLPHMLAARLGHIVNISSTAGKVGPPFGAAYAASKAALIAFTRSLRSEYRSQGVSASVICPGFTHDGGMYERIKSEVGRETPWLVGSTSTKAVTKAVLRAIKRDKPELIVNDPPLRPLTILMEMIPSLGEWIAAKASTPYLRSLASRRRTGGHEQSGH